MYGVYTSARTEAYAKKGSWERTACLSACVTGGALQMKGQCATFIRRGSNTLWLLPALSENCLQVIYDPLKSKHHRMPL